MNFKKYGIGAIKFSIYGKLRAESFKLDLMY